MILAVAKGRILDETLKFLAKLDVYPTEDPYNSRLLCFETNDQNLKLIVVRTFDVPTYVMNGAADLGIVGKDVLEESQCDNFYELVDLKFSACRLSLASKEHDSYVGKHFIKVATKYPNITHQFFSQRGVQAKTIKLHGSMELAPAIGLADYIVDLVDTGKTLESNGLSVIENMMHSSARLIANKASLKKSYPQAQEWIHKFEQLS